MGNCCSGQATAPDVKIQSLDSMTNTTPKPVVMPEGQSVEIIDIPKV